MAITYQGLFAAALIALILTVASAFFLGKRGPWDSIWTFFLVLFLILSTVSIYVSPIGPVYWGIAWIPILVAGIIVTILLIAAMPHPHSGNNRDKTEVNVAYTRQDSRVTPVGRFFWALVILLAIAIIIGMANPQLAL
jgi:hypothetical protein